MKAPTEYHTLSPPPASEFGEAHSTVEPSNIVTRSTRRLSNYDLAHHDYTPTDIASFLDTHSQTAHTTLDEHSHHVPSAPVHSPNDSFFSQFKHLSQTVVALSFTSLFNSIGSEMLAVVLPLYMNKGLKMPNTVIGLVEGFSYVISALMKIAAGLTVDYIHNHKWFTGLGYLLAAASRPCLLLSSSLSFIVFCRWLERIGKGLRSSPRDALVAKSVQKSNRSFSYSVLHAGQQFGCVFSLAFAIILLYFQQHIIESDITSSWRAIVYLSTPFGLFAVLSVILFVRDDESELNSNRNDQRRDGNYYELQPLLSEPRYILVQPDEESPSSSVNNSNSNAIQPQQRSLLHGHQQQQRDSVKRNESRDDTRHTSIYGSTEHTTTLPLQSIGRHDTSSMTSSLPLTEQLDAVDTPLIDLPPLNLTFSGAEHGHHSQNNSQTTTPNHALHQSLSRTSSSRKPIKKGQIKYYTSTGDVFDHPPESNQTSSSTKGSSNSSKGGGSKPSHSSSSSRHVKSPTQKPAPNKFAYDVPHSSSSNAAPETPFNSLVISLILILCLGQLGTVSSPFLVLLADRYDFSLTEILVLIFVYDVIYSGITTPAGLFTDRLNRRHKHGGAYTVAFGWAIRSMILIFLALSTSQASMVFGFIFYGAYSGLTEGVVKALLADALPQASSQLGSIFATFDSLVGLSDLTNNAVAGYFFDSNAVPAWLWLNGILGFAACISLLFWRSRVEPNSEIEEHISLSSCVILNSSLLYSSSTSTSTTDLPSSLALPKAPQQQQQYDSYTNNNHHITISPVSNQYSSPYSRPFSLYDNDYEQQTATVTTSPTIKPITTAIATPACVRDIRVPISLVIDGLGRRPTKSDLLLLERGAYNLANFINQLSLEGRALSIDDLDNENNILRLTTAAVVCYVNLDGILNIVMVSDTAAQIKKRKIRMQRRGYAWK